MFFRDLILIDGFIGAVENRELLFRVSVGSTKE